MRNEGLRKLQRRAVEAEAAASSAVAAADAAKAAYRSSRLAKRRVDDLIKLINFRFAGEPVSKEIAEPYVRCLLSALAWEQRDVQLACRFVANTFASWDVYDLMMAAEERHVMTSQDVARMLRVKLEERQALGLAMIGACDLSDEEYAAFLRAEDRARRAERSRRSRPRDLETRKQDEAERREAVKALAEAHGKTVRTIYRWLKTGVLDGMSKSHAPYSNTQGHAILTSAKGQRPQGASGPKAA